jgi:hypothetical protein
MTGSTINITATTSLVQTPRRGGAQDVGQERHVAPAQGVCDADEQEQAEIEIQISGRILHAGQHARRDRDQDDLAKQARFRKEMTPSARR